MQVYLQEPSLAVVMTALLTWIPRPLTEFISELRCNAIFFLLEQIQTPSIASPKNLKAIKIVELPS